MKSIKMFGKKIPILAILVIVMISGAGVYGAVVTYLSKTIKTKTVVDSPITLEGELKYWPADRGFFTTATGGEAKWSSKVSKTGYSAKLSVALAADEARLAFGYSGLLKDVADIIYSSYVQGASGDLHPFVVLAIDNDDDGGPDSWVVQWENSALTPNGENDWIETTFGGGTYVHVAGDRTGLGPDQPGNDYISSYITTADLDTLDELIEETFTDSTKWGDLSVIQIKVMVGEFTGLSELLVAYVDDVSGAVASNCDPVLAAFDEAGSASIDVFAGSEFYMTFDIENQANVKMDGRLKITVDGLLNFDGAGGEIAIGPVGYTRTGTIDYVYTLDTAYTFEPLTSVEFPIRMQLSSIAAPDTYTFSVKVVP